MLLLVSVRNATEAMTALAGGADIIDAKEPTAGALGAVNVATFHDIHGAVARTRPVSAAIGDAEDEDTVERHARAFATAGAEFVKVGVSSVRSALRGRSFVTAAVRGSRGTTAVAYADVSGGISHDAVLDIAAEAGARGVLLDTADKDGPGLRVLLDARALETWVTRARNAGLLVALAGKLTAEDLAFVCDAGRNGTVSEAKVRRLVSSLRLLSRGARRPEGLRLPRPKAMDLV